MKAKIILILFILLTFNINNVYSHDNIIVHPEITKNAIENSTLDYYLKNNLNLTKGLETRLPSDGGNPVLELLSKGSTTEDSIDACRAWFCNVVKFNFIIERYCT